MRLSATRRGAISTGRGLGSRLYDLAGVPPSLDLQFASQRVLDSRVSFVRGSIATYVGSDGLIKTAAANEPRFTHDPVTGDSLGLLIEEDRTNLLLNSATLSTQSTTVAAVPTTLSFYGTGAVTLSGASTAGPVTGAGSNARVSLTFTPTAGLLTLTVSGTVINAQLEAGSFPTSYIPTTTSTATRAADVAQITGANFSSWYRQDEGTIFSDSTSTHSATQILVNIGASTAISVSSAISIASNLSSSQKRVRVRDSSSVDQASLAFGSSSSGSRMRVAVAIRANDFAASLDGGTALTDLSGTVPTVALMEIGSAPSAVSLGVQCHRRLAVWPQRLPNPTLQAMTQE